MISPTKTARIGRHSGSVSYFNAVEEAYEKGMEEVLRELALIKNAQYEKHGVRTEEIEETITQVIDQYKQVASGLSGEDLDNFKEYEAIANHLASLESEQSFIQGFIEGYRFLKCINEGSFEDKEKARPAATERAI